MDFAELAVRRAELLRLMGWHTLTQWLRLAPRDNATATAAAQDAVDYRAYAARLRIAANLDVAGDRETAFGDALA